MKMDNSPKISPRAIRRSCLVVKKNKCRRIIKDIWRERNLLNDQKFIGRMVQTPHPCSKSCCGNPRHYWKGEKLTLQERKAEKINVVDD
jgi:hypothetical protein